MSKTLDKIGNYFKENGLTLLTGALSSVATGNPTPLLGTIASTLGTEPTAEAVERELSKNDPSTLIKLKQMEQDHKIELERITLEYQRLENEKFIKSHDTYKEQHAMADRIAEQVIRYNLPVIGLLVVINVLVLHYFKDDATLIAIASNVIGVAMGHLFGERQAIVNFFFGSSLGSKKKSDQLAEFQGKTR